MESFEDRIMPSAASVASQMAEQWGQVMAVAEQDVRNAWNWIAQEVSYAQQQVTLLLGNVANPQNPSLGTVAPQTGSSLTTTQEARFTSSSVTKAKPQVWNEPTAPGFGGYLWDPVNGTNASDGHNWDYGGKSQKNAANPLKPGDTPDGVLFDPQSTQAPGLNGNGASAITWDYKPSGVISILLGGQSAYTGTQTINKSITVDASVTAQNTASDFHLNFTDGTSKFQIDGDSTITNMHLGGDKAGQFLINSGTTAIAQNPGYAEQVGTSFVIAAGATLQHWAWNSLQFSASNLALKVQGTMLIVFRANHTNPLIDINGNTKDYIDVNGGSLKYGGTAGQKDTFTVPVLVENGGTFQVTSDATGWLIVQGNLNGTAPGVNNNASVYMKDAGSSVQLNHSSTLECDGDYYQADGLLETTDASTCTLQDGPTGSLGTATIAGGVLAIYNPPGGVRQAGVYAFFNMNCSQLNFNGTYEPNIAGNVSGANTSDILTINKSQGTINLQGGSALKVFVDNPPPAGQQFTWPIIKAGKFVNPQFNTQSSVPNTPGLKYGPAGATEYDVTF